MKFKRLLITGGAGFIGSNLAERLSKDANSEVIIIDNLSTGKIKNIAGIINKENVTFIRGSILDIGLLDKTFNNIDFVFHQAAIPSVAVSIDDPFPTNEVNVTGTLAVLIAARKNRVKKVVFASSSSVYGDTITLPKNETMPTNVQSPYALTKLVGENYCRIFNRIYGLPTICLRYFNVYGPRQNLKSEHAAVIPSFIASVLENKPPVIYGDGCQTRDFTFVDDVVEANILAAESEATGVFNIGGGHNVTINELANIIIATLGRSLQPVHKEPRLGDVRDSLADISLAKSIGYEPKHTLESGLQETIKRFKGVI